MKKVAEESNLHSCDSNIDIDRRRYWTMLTIMLSNKFERYCLTHFALYQLQKWSFLDMCLFIILPAPNLLTITVFFATKDSVERTAQIKTLERNQCKMTAINIHTIHGSVWIRSNHPINAKQTRKKTIRIVNAKCMFGMRACHFLIKYDIHKNLLINLN